MWHIIAIELIIIFQVLSILLSADRLLYEVHKLITCHLKCGEFYESHGYR